ncbi:YidC/Oxa1 family membrane protein insertase [Patulibacter brassicae]|uniref:Membrane protein insertase YidC n=1 Tax=Patulibacter brassicae TaxID=1705717 RepID=A0ABU4VKZ4_9ACTN|nr:YidC/Oxa1 family membrane protein insertase [Patulibacter brassicae]MDX8152468.1 YidC/Oxa1 family membrane protein insertase [Patulibacter brassicae]
MPVAVLAPIQWLIDIFLPVMEFFHDSLGIGWGLSIILLTILLRLLVLPLGVKSFKSMRGLQAIAPQMKALQAKYKDDRQRLQQETMKLYAEHKVNPFGSCLPIIAQIPFLIAFFYMLRTDLKFEICGQGRDLNLPHDVGCHQVPNPSTGFTYDAASYAADIKGKVLGGFGEGFLGITDITAVATGGLLVLLLVLYVGSQMASSLVNMPPTADKNQKRLMLALPLVFVIFLIPIKPPSGLFIYWITTNVFTLVQQWGLIRVYGHAKPAAVPDEPEVAGGAAAVRTSAPPPPPRKKKKRSGRRR